MSFLFNWTDLQHIDFKSMINKTLSQFHIPQFPNKLHLKTLHLDRTPPVLKILDIQEFSLDRLQLQVEFKYHGKLELGLNSRLEINSLNLMEFDDFTKPRFVMANKSTIIPIDFGLSDFHVDSVMTLIFIKKINKLVLVFNQDPEIEFKLTSSIDELLDDDVVCEIRNDALGMCLGFVKNELPLIVNGYSMFEGMDAVHDIEIEDYTKPSRPEIANKQRPNDVFGCFNTLSLLPSKFDGVLERISLKEEFAEESMQSSQSSLSTRKKRRVIKIKGSNKSSPSRASPAIMSTLSPQVPPLNETTIDSPTLLDTSIDLTVNSIDEYGPDDMFDFTLPPSSPHLHNGTSIFNEKENDADSNTTFEASFNHIQHNSDPYENLLHPLDILPSFGDLTSSLSDKEYNSSTPSTSCIFEYDSDMEGDIKHNRRASSNYINLNDFKRK